MILEIAGKDILPFVASLQFKRADLDGSNAGRTMDGKMYRDRITTKVTISVELRALPTQELQFVLSLLDSEFFYVTYTDPLRGERTCQMYTNNIPTTIAYIDEWGNAVWDGISFNMIER